MKGENKGVYPGHTIESTGELIVGQSEQMKMLYRYVRVATSKPTTVLLRGESGTGKELVAKALHFNGGRKGKFVSLDCSAIPSELMEAHLFGHEKGAYTGAHKEREGLVKAADEGTIFFDEISNMSFDLQAKLLRFLQERKIRRIGQVKEESVDVRVVAATNENLESLIEDGIFREDLYYRLNVVPIRIPPLRERKEDIPLIAEYFIDKYCDLHEGRVLGLSADAIDKLKEYEWPGNVRELENIIQRAVIFSGVEEIGAGQIVFDGKLPQLPDNIQILIQTNAQPKSYGSQVESETLITEEVEDLKNHQRTLPVTFSYLSKLEGTYSPATLRDRLYTGNFFYKEFGDKRKWEVIFLDENWDEFFRDPTTEDAVQLSERIRKFEFAGISISPFMVTTAEDLQNYTFTFTNQTILSRLSRIGSYTIQSTPRYRPFVLREREASNLVPERLQPEGTIALQRVVRKEYKQFLDFFRGSAEGNQ